MGLSINQGFALPPYDAIVIDETGVTSNVYTYKKGGVSGTTVATVTVNFTDGTKATTASVVRS